MDFFPNTSPYKIFDNKWVFKIKYNIDGNVVKYKARLIANYFQKIERVNHLK